MLPEDIGIATLQTMGLGTIASLMSLYLSYRWNLIRFQAVKWTRNQIIIVYLGVLGYVLLNSIALSLLIVGFFYPTLLYAIVGYVIISASPFVLIFIFLLACTIQCAKDTSSATGQ